MNQTNQPKRDLWPHDLFTAVSLLSARRDQLKNDIANGKQPDVVQEFDAMIDLFRSFGDCVLQTDSQESR